MTDPLGLIPDLTSSRAILPPQGIIAAGGPTGGPNFKQVLMQNIEQVNRLQQDAELAIEDLAAGRRDDLDGVLMAKQKADMAFQLLLQVRNKVVDAYEEIKQMKV